MTSPRPSSARSYKVGIDPVAEADGNSLYAETSFGSRPEIFQTSNLHSSEINTPRQSPTATKGQYNQHGNSRPGSAHSSTGL